jgi:hypothetical protein
MGIVISEDLSIKILRKNFVEENYSYKFIIENKDRYEYEAGRVSKLEASKSLLLVREESISLSKSVIRDEMV